MRNYLANYSFADLCALRQEAKFFADFSKENPSSRPDEDVKMTHLHDSIKKEIFQRLFTLVKVMGREVVKEN